MIRNNLIQGNSLEYFKNQLNINIKLVLTSPSYYTDTPKRNKRENELGVGETKESYVELIIGVLRDIDNYLLQDGMIVLVIGQYGDKSIRSILFMIEDKLSKIGIVMNGYKEFGKGNSEAIVIFSKRKQNIIIPQFDKLQVYKRVGFFGEISPKILTWAIENFSKKGQLVVDPFAGAGSTIKKAIQLQRSALGVELNGDYIK